MSAFDQGWRAFQEGRPLDAYPMGHKVEVGVTAVWPDGHEEEER